MARPSQMIKRFLPKSLFGRSLMIIITPLILLQVVSTWIFFDRHWDTITRRLASSIASKGKGPAVQYRLPSTAAES